MPFNKATLRWVGPQIRDLEVMDFLNTPDAVKMVNRYPGIS